MELVEAREGKIWMGFYRFRTRCFASPAVVVGCCFCFPFFVLFFYEIDTSISQISVISNESKSIQDRRQGEGGRFRKGLRSEAFRGVCYFVLLFTVSSDISLILKVRVISQLFIHWLIIFVIFAEPFCFVWFRSSYLKGVCDLDAFEEHLFS